jgi:hypothetical protein
VLVTIAPDSPAATALKSHDILLKLDDQLLVDPRQLSVLVRNHKDGDEVTLTYIRGGKETTAKVKLGKHDVPKMAMGEGFGRQSFDSPGNPGGRAFGEVRGSREEMSRVLSLIDRAQSPGPGGMPSPQGTVRFYRNEGPGFRATAISTANSNMVFSDDQGTIDLTIKEGKKTLVAKNAKGEQIFSGAVDTPEQRQSLPAEVRERLERIEGMQGFSFQTDQDFVPGTVRIGPPPAQGIGTPMPAPAFNEPAPRIF